ncbi:MAG: hypothetical protein HETSPECPRED_007713 [Heterodermia speciosa]|uniref:Phospholipase D n=1 Tax=Heterodermia speciosa TaxID=116794 RepID=A0A8H3FRC5_9LECA|nr:MAG: hypothetical protein HETSPECPRED_007713 [Heterodermia speciosa]
MAPAQPTPTKRSVISPRPFHVIGHRVLVKQGVYDALNSGINALEIDITAQPEGWWADHDGNALSRGRTTSFVWLEIKNPDAFNPFLPGERNGSIKELRNLARKVSQTHGIHVLYGFYYTKSNAYRSLQGKLNSPEAINLNGKTQDALQGFQTQGLSQVEKRVMSHGYFHLLFKVR